MRRHVFILATLIALPSCSDTADDPDASGGAGGVAIDVGAATGDAGDPLDAGRDAGSGDTRDAGATTDAGPVRDTGASSDTDTGGSNLADSGTSPRDAGTPDAGVPDLGTPDMGAPDLGAPDLGAPDMGTPMAACNSGAQGTHVARFRWEGNGSGSRAYVVYEENTLPDTSRWKAGAFSSNFSYRPVFGDPFLGDGGLEMGSTVFMDIELSTMGLSTIRSVTLGLRGRSYNTTSPGSFSWQTFSGTGATPRGSVSNSAPYQWYTGDATGAIPPNDGGILLRIRSAGPSSSLVVNAFEICIDGS